MSEPGKERLQRQETVPVGVVLTRKRIDHPWKDHTWIPSDVIPGAPERDPQGPWTVLASEEGWASYHAGTLPLNLFRSDTEGYRFNLSQSPPRVFVVLRRPSTTVGEREFVPFLVTANPYEAQDYLDSGEDIVEGVAMPDSLIALVQAFVDQHHVDQPFHKRKRRSDKPDKRGRRQE